MKITVIGATGMIGSRIVAEAAQRDHEVTAASRSGAMAKGASRATAMELSDTSAVRAAIDASDTTVIAVSPDGSGGSHEPTIRAHRNLIAAQPSGRFLVVGGAGSLEIDGVRLEDTDMAYKLGANSFLVKPLDFQNSVEMAKTMTEYWLRLSKSSEIGRPATERKADSDGHA